MPLLKDLFDEALKNQPKSKESSTIPQRKRIDNPKTGFKGVFRVYCQGCKQKFMYQYEYWDKKDKKIKRLTSVDFLKLKQRVLDKNLKWEMESLYYARKTAKEVGLPVTDLK